MSPWQTFWKLPLGIKVLLPRVWVLLNTFWVLIRILPFSWAQKLLGLKKSQVPPLIKMVRPEKNELEGKIAIAVEVTARRFAPWAKCLEQALAAAFLLNRRNIRSFLCIGVFLEEKNMGSHAWLRVGSKCITGYHGSMLCKQIVCFSKTQSDKITTPESEIDHET